VDHQSASKIDHMFYNGRGFLMKNVHRMTPQKMAFTV
jgi:hypothetical protein